MKASNLYIGCSGFYYPTWKGKFYPKELKPREWLGYYSTVFNTVELNGTFYRLPKMADLKKYYALTPPNFRFSVKMSRFITHIKRLKDCTESIEKFTALIEDGLGDKLGSILYQMPPTFKYTEENLELVTTAIQPGAHNVIEFRQQDWWNAKVFKALKQSNLTFCNVNFPGMDTPFKATTDLFYLRLHGNPELFKSSYSMDELTQFSKQIPKSAKQVNIYFNNTYFEAGYTNAMQIKEIMKTKR